MLVVSLPDNPEEQLQITFVNDKEISPARGEDNCLLHAIICNINTQYNTMYPPQIAILKSVVKQYS